ncbi:pentapeptide repeat-containing protein [Actinopolyspora mortivallis]|uniref:Pentapeptide repeat-containing protein n=1 Tax=Actinopolyspora mortivallis TaxID=33906 RepID=A0A2T0GRK1_ACTMO|nr:pentapeptide repeat-containing protein [Actinopolyspora mortivallis]PRW61735.1 hypothetical protein CEP50_19145 [Actinopolyspora mortivallis]
MLVPGVLVWMPVDWSMLVSWAAKARTVSGASHLPVLLTIAGAGLSLALLVARALVRNRRSDPDSSHTSIRPMPEWAVWVGPTVLLTVGITTACLLLSFFGGGGDHDRIRLEAIKLASSIAVGVGGAALLVLAARRQRANELSVLQQEQAQRLQERKAAQSKHDVDERRATELYTSAAQQLASGQAPVRMAGLYALSRLGQNNPDHRQAVVNLFCAYLRMPYTPPETERSDCEREEYAHRFDPRSPGRALRDSPALATLLKLTATQTSESGQLTDTEHQRQERQVRLTAQRLLTRHLRPCPDEHGRPTNEEFWDGMDLDLVEAVLDHWDFRGCRVHSADFTLARFYGIASFSGARFHDVAWFAGARFHGPVFFNETRFHGAPPEFDRSWARLDRGSFRASTWPAGWTVEEAEPGLDWGRHWLQFVRHKEAGSESDPGTTSTECDTDPERPLALE